MNEGRQICGAEDELDFIGFVCELAPGHAGEHEAAYSWANEPHGPQPARTPNRFLPQAWGESLYDAQLRLTRQQLEVAINNTPFTALRDDA